MVKRCLPFLGRSVFLSVIGSRCVFVCVCVHTEPTMDGSGGVYPVHPVLGESRHVQLRPLSVGAAHWRNSLRSLKTW